MPHENAQLLRLVRIIRRLRAPDGCPWDRKQTLSTLTSHILEEGYELIEAIEEKADEKICEEAGDLIMVVLMICQVASDEGRFDLEAAARSISDKLIRRHPHVFHRVSVKNAEDVVENWEEIKKKERLEKGEDTSALAGIPKGMPALLRSIKIGEKASRVGFDWPDAKEAMKKIQEEFQELEEVLAEPKDEARIVEELGDLLFAVANVGRILGVNPELALRATLDKFDKRFRRMEKKMAKPLGEATFSELDQAWEATKRMLRTEESKNNTKTE